MTSATPVVAGVTPSLELRCRLEATDGRLDISSHDHTQTSVHAVNVTSILLTQDGLDLAVVSHVTPARVLSEFRDAYGLTNDVAVKASINTSSKVKGELTATISDPGPDNAAEYGCWVRAVTARGLEVRYADFLDVYVEPSA